MIRALVSLVMFAVAALPMAAPAATRIASQTVSGKTITALADRSVRSLKLDKDHAFTPAFTVPDQVMSPGRVALSYGQPIVTPSYINVPVTISLNGKFSRAVYVGYRVLTYISQAVAAHDIAPGTTLSAGDVEMKKVAFAGRQPNGTDVLVGRRVISSFVKGQSIFIDSTTADQIVKAGSTVIMIVRDGGVALTADVIARTSGGLGDQVIVFNPLTNKQLSGTVTGPGRVELELPGGEAQ